MGAQTCSSSFVHRVVGLRFLSPVLLINLVESVYLPSQSSVMADLSSMLRESGKQIFKCTGMSDVSGAASEQLLSANGTNVSLATSRLRLTREQSLMHQNWERKKRPARLNGTLDDAITGDEEDECVVCMSAPRNVVFSSCGHRVLCSRCVSLLTNMECPICRRPFTRER